MEPAAIRLNRIEKEIGNPIRNWGTGYIAEVMMEFAEDYHNDKLLKMKDKINPDNYKLINPEEYLNLKFPNFIGQSRPNNEGIYYMFWEDEGILYKTQNKI
jgi:hypothetical protein